MIVILIKIKIITLVKRKSGTQASGISGGNSFNTFSYSRDIGIIKPRYKGYKSCQ
jgi:hypothetical protein